MVNTQSLRSKLQRAKVAEADIQRLFKVGKLDNAAGLRQTLSELNHEIDSDFELLIEENRSFEQDRHATGFQIIESDEIRAKVAFEIRDWAAVREIREELADELIQDALIHLAGKIDNYQPGTASVKTWIFEKPKGLLWGFLRNLEKGTAWLRLQEQHVSADDVVGIDDGDGSETTRLEEYEFRQALQPAGGPDGGFIESAQKLLADLCGAGAFTERQSHLWAARYLGTDKMDFESVAAEFGVSTENARQIVSRVNKALREHLEANGIAISKNAIAKKVPAPKQLGEEDAHEQWETDRAAFWADVREDAQKSAA